MRDDADRVYQDKTTLVVRPHTEALLVIMGKEPDGVSQQPLYNYWDDYSTEQGKTFFFILDKNAELKEDTWTSCSCL